MVNIVDSYRDSATTPDINTRRTPWPSGIRRISIGRYSTMLIRDAVQMPRTAVAMLQKRGRCNQPPPQLQQFHLYQKTCRRCPGDPQRRRRQLRSSRFVGEQLRQSYPVTSLRLVHGEELSSREYEVMVKERSEQVMQTSEALHSGPCTEVVVRIPWQRRQERPHQPCHQSLPRPRPSCPPSSWVSRIIIIVIVATS